MNPLEFHEKYKGKIKVCSKVPLKTKDDLSLAYTPGVAEPCLKIKENKENIYKYTFKGNSVAVVTDGSAVLGLGNIGPEAALPVMEGKAVLFKEFADIDAFPICLNTQDPEEIIKTVKNIAPSFGGINLEDISAPRCFEIEERLRQELDIPVFHDDQHGTAVVVLAALINAAKVIKKDIKDLKIMISGAGAAGIAIAKILKSEGIKEIVLVDSKGAIYYCREDLNKFKKQIALITNIECKGKKGLKDPEECKRCMRGNLKETIKGKDVFIGVSAPNIVNEEMISSMNKDPIVFAMANPTPEIMPDKAKQAGAKIVATGRSDFPNQINNVLAFPGIFRGALNKRAKITEKMKLAAAHALASIIEPDENNILPSPFNKEIVKKISKAVEEKSR